LNIIHAFVDPFIPIHPVLDIEFYATELKI
jgi:hypothetical protein